MSRRLLQTYSPLALLVLVVLHQYSSHLLPGMHDFGDITKAQFLGRFLGMTHPTGYPLYILLTAPLSALPFGSLALRINAFSAVCGLGAVILTYGLLRQLRVRPALAALTAGAFAFSRTAWEQFSIAEVYGLNALLVAAVLFLLLRWLSTAKVMWFLAACGVYALAFGNHLTMVTLLPAFALGTFAGRFRMLLTPKVALSVVGLILLGISQYGYLFWASQSDSLYLEYRVETFDDFVEFVSGERYRRVMFAFEWQQYLAERLPRFVEQLVRDLGPLALLAPLGLLGLGAPSTSAPSASVSPSVPSTNGLPPTSAGLAVLLTAALGQLAWVMGYDIPDIQVYLIPLTMIVAVLAGVALEGFARRLPVGWPQLGPLLLATAIVVPLPYLNAPNFSKAKTFTRRLDATLDVMGHDAALVSRIHYSPRMGYVYRLYAEGLSEDRNLHLAYRASAKQVQKYLKGKGQLIDSHTGKALPPGLRLFVDSRGARQGWGKRLRLKRQGRELRELTLKPKAPRKKSPPQTAQGQPAVRPDSATPDQPQTLP